MKKLLPVLCALTLLLPAAGLSQNKNQRVKEAAAAAARARREEAQRAEEMKQVLADADRNKSAEIKGLTGQSGSDLSHARSHSNAAANAPSSEAAHEAAARAWYDVPEAPRQSASTRSDWTSNISSRDIDDDPYLSSRQKEELKKALFEARNLSARITQDKKTLENKRTDLKAWKRQRANLSSHPDADFTLLDRAIDRTDAEIARLENSVKDKQARLDAMKTQFSSCTNCRPALQ